MRPKHATRRIAGRALAHWARGPGRRSNAPARIRVPASGLLELEDRPGERAEKERTRYRSREAERRSADPDRIGSPTPALWPATDGDAWASGYREVQGLSEDALLAEVKRRVLDQIFAHNVDLADRLTGS